MNEVACAQQESSRSNSDRVYRGSAHGKIILMGEHSAVYAKPAIVLPLSEASITATVTDMETECLDSSGVRLDCEYYVGKLSKAPENLRNIQELVVVLRNDFSIDGGISISITSSIPRERGMGSSAAVAVAIIRACAAYAHYSLTPDELFHYTQISENIAHAHASGMDAVAVSAESAIWFQQGEEVSTLHFSTPAVLVAADTGVTGATKEAVSDVHRLLYEDDDVVRNRAHRDIERLADLSIAAKRALQENDMTSLGAHMNEAQEILSTLTVSSGELDSLIQTARGAGALGAKLTGGGRGGCMIALARDKAHAHSIITALESAGAVRTWTVNLTSPSK
ncbi:mevalonate kinase [Alloscardovia venturai]